MFSGVSDNEKLVLTENDVLSVNLTCSISTTMETCVLIFVREYQNLGDQEEDVLAAGTEEINN